MSERTASTTLRLRVLNADRKPLGGAVDVEIWRPRSKQNQVLTSANAAADVDVQIGGRGLHYLTVTPTDVFRPVSRAINLVPGRSATIEVVIDKGKDISPDDGYQVYGTVRDALQKPLSGAVVKVFDKDIRNEQALGESAKTDAAGIYQVRYTRRDFARTDTNAADIIVRIVDKRGRVIKESSVFYNAPTRLRVDLSLSDAPYAGPSEFERMVGAVTPYTGKLPLADLEENDKTQDITFLTNKTGLDRNPLETLAMAARFDKDTGIETAVFYGLIERTPSRSTLTQPTANSPSTSLDAKATLIFATLMRTEINSLMASLSAAVAANVIPYSVSAELTSVRAQLVTAQEKFSKSNPQTTAADGLSMKLAIAGLQGDQVAAFKGLFSASAGTPQAFWETLAKNPAFQTQQAALLQSVFNLSQLTGEQVVLTDPLIKSQGISSPADLPKLAANTQDDWLALLKKQNIQAPAGIPGATPAIQQQNYAAQLEINFTQAFPTPAFAARIQKDEESKIPNAVEIGQFLNSNEDFDLLNTRIGSYLQKKHATTSKVASKSAAKSASTATSVTADFVNQLKRTQRIFKIAPNYASANVLLGDGLGSAQKIYEMGQNRFVAQYSETIGAAGATRIFQKASKTHAMALALTANLKSLSDASHLSVFPDYTTTISDAMSTEVPDLDTLFGHTDFCECDECRSVYGAAAYLADILHFLELRVTSIPCSAGKNASVAEALLRRRPDLADIDLTCDNTNTQIPYIDIANEIMEDFIAPPQVNIDATWLPKFVAGPIDAGLSAAIVAQFQAAGQANLAALLTQSASISDSYSMERLQDDDTCVTEDHWIIRDQLIVLKATNQAAGMTVQLVHQTLLSSDEVNANPEYTNVAAYQVLKADVRPFSLPFDLFETEGEIYLKALGTPKAALIDAFRAEHQPAVAPSAATQSDLDVAFAFLGVNQTERTLIFQADTADQTDYWGTLASGTAVELDLFMNVTGLSYGQVLELLALRTINPAKDSVILSDDLSCDTNTKHVNNLTLAKFDIIHRFLRLWKKTTLTLEELDAIVQAPALGNGAITADLAWKLHRFLEAMKLWSLSAFQYLAFFGNLDTAAPDDLYDSLFQNREITNPLNPDFAAKIVSSTAPPPPAITAVHKGLLIGVLGLAPAELDGLIAKTDGLLSLSNISYFYRTAQLVQALSVSIDDLAILLDIINVSPFTDPPTTHTFYVHWRTVVASQFAAADLNYVLRQQQDSDGSYVASDDIVAAALADLQAKILQAQSATAVVPDPLGQTLKKWVIDPLLNWNPALIAKLMDILGTQDDTEFQQKVDNNQTFLLNLRVQYHDSVLTADLSAMPVGYVIPDSLAAQLSYDTTTLQLEWIGYMSSADQALLTAVPTSPAFQSAVTQLFQAAQQTSSSASNLFFANAADINANLRSLVSPQLPVRYQLFIKGISPSYRTLMQQAAVQNELCGWFKINKDIASAILASQPGIYADFTDPNFVSKTQALLVANFPNQFAWYQKIAKMAFIVTKLKLNATDLSWLMAHAADAGSLDLWSLPIVPVTGVITTFAGFEVLVNILKFEQYFPAVSNVTAASTTTLSIYDILDDAIDATGLPAVLADLSALTGWDIGQLALLVSAPTNYLNLTYPADFKNISILLRLRQCFAAMTNLGAAPADCVAWAQPSLSFDDSSKIKQALKSRYSDDQWLGVTQPLQKTVRNAKSDALIAHLLANPPAGQTWLTSDDLYSYFLIDVEMTACQPTSRIVQATNSVQQFVQRCFLNLEVGITVDLTLDADWSQWQWMKYFRLWQANRKIFLYPENWIEPELLPAKIKSPFFSDLQNDLLQNAVTQDTVEAAFLDYLEKLDGVARLEVKAMWYDDAKQTLHVVSRSFGGDPKTYYYRQFVQNMRWTPWVKIDQDIASDHIVLTVFNHRIYLFWAVFTEKTAEVTSVTVPAAPGSSPATMAITPQDKFWQIQLAFSEFKEGKWTPKKVSTADSIGSFFVTQVWTTAQADPLTGQYGTYIPAKSDFVFTPLDLPDLSFTQSFFSGTMLKDANGFLSGLLQGLEQSLTSNGDFQINCYTALGPNSYEYQCTFDLDPCRGYPVVVKNEDLLVTKLFDDSQLVNMLDTEEDNPSDTLAVDSAVFLGATPGTFTNLVSLQMSFVDRLINLIYQFLYSLYYPNTPERRELEDRMPVTVGTFLPYFYQDQARTYFAQPEFSDNADFEFSYQDLEDYLLALLEGNSVKAGEIQATFPQGQTIKLLVHFFNFYHPLACSFMRILYDQGIDAMMSRDTQLQGDTVFDSNPNKFDFKQVYAPTSLIYSGTPVTYIGPNGPVTDQNPGYPKGDVSFDPKDGYSLYNWELFFHAPLMIAQRLDQNLQFDDADHWFKYIFNPTDGSKYPSPDKYWMTKPFFINVNNKYVEQDINNILLGIDANNSALVQDVTDWQNNPFQPHYIAQYRTVAYQKTAVMKYLDHLIAWGDSLYQQDTMETVLEAEQLYVLADQILGPKPLIIPTSYASPVDNFGQLQQKLDAFSNALVDIENLLPLQQVAGFTDNSEQKLPSLQTLYFCIPPNDQLMAYWDTVAGRLYNIRNCLTLGGQYAPLALFAPVIDPGLLVRATAAGLDIGSILADMNSPLPNYRFTVMVQKTLDLCGEVKALGSALLQAMEKKDAEDLALLRSKNSIGLLNAILLVKKQQVDEATHNLEALQQQQALVNTKITYYQSLITAGLNNWETAFLALTQVAIAGDTSAVQIEYLGNVLGLIPDFDIGAEGFGGSPAATVKFGGTQLGGATRAIASAIRGTAGVAHSEAGVAATQATYTRRAAEWAYQLSLANAELQQVAKQILAATVRQSVANQEVTNQQLQIDNAQAEDDFIHAKFTNSDLYAYMVSQLSTTYFQSYQLAYALAKQTEQTFRYELGLADSSYINFGYWNTLEKGLLAGEQLTYDVRNMEKAYRDQNVREYELSKSISLSQLDASALQQLITNRECWFNLPEELFDIDYPGHYLRRIKTVSLTIPCVAGPYTTISCVLTMTKNSVRANNSSGVAYPRKTVSGVAADDPRFRDSVGAMQSIATSTAQNDDGLFELSFRDERYLPFEGGGAISQWHIQLPSGVTPLDYNSISDVIVHLKYTARDGGDSLRADASTSLQTRINSMLVSLKDTGLMRLFSARHEFPTEWYAFLNAAANTDQVLTLNLTRDRFPYFVSVAPTLKITSIELIADTSAANINAILAAPAPQNAAPLNFTKDNYYGSMLRLVLDYSGSKKDSGIWTITNPKANPVLTSAQLSDLILIVHYAISLT